MSHVLNAILLSFSHINIKIMVTGEWGCKMTHKPVYLMEWEDEQDRHLWPTVIVVWFCEQKEIIGELISDGWFTLFADFL